jgi:acetylornithine deacetylase
MIQGQIYTPLEMLERLVAFDTESAKSNLGLIDFVSEYLAGWGVYVTRTHNADGNKATILATLGPADRPGIVLSGHTDVVPVTGQVWASDPFRLRVAEGRAYARGAVDMKGFDALALALVPHFLAAGLRMPIHIVLSYDEETTCLGSIDIIKRFGRDLPLPVAAIVGEPTGLAVVDAHKSVATFQTEVYGHAAHSSKPALGANAVAAAGDLIHGLNTLADEMVALGDPSGRFDPAYTTVHIGMVHGGHARNILADRCTIHWEYRGLPDLDAHEIPRRFDALAAEVLAKRLNRYGAHGRIETEWEVLVPGLAPETGSFAQRLGLALTGSHTTETVPFGTEAGHFQAAGIPTIVCGPGTIDRAHQPDEYITLDELAAGEAFLRTLAAGCVEGEGWTRGA